MKKISDNKRVRVCVLPIDLLVQRSITFLVEHPEKKTENVPYREPIPTPQSIGNSRTITARGSGSGLRRHDRHRAANDLDTIRHVRHVTGLAGSGDHKENGPRFACSHGA